MIRSCAWCRWSFDGPPEAIYCCENCETRARQWKESGIDRLRGAYLVTEITDADPRAHSWYSRPGPR